MINIYCDEDVDVLLKPLLEAKGFKVLTTFGEKNLGNTDSQQMSHALSKGYLLLTHNRIHFERLYGELIAKGTNHHGLIIAGKRNVYELARRISRVLSGYSQDSIINQIIYI